MIILRNNANNVLPNTYIPDSSPKHYIAMLGKLSKRSLIQFMTVWIKLKSCQPHLPKKTTLTQLEFADKVKREIDQLKHTSTQYSKRQVIEKIVYDYWSHGLNLLQLSQIDCQLIVDKPKSSEWIHSTAKDMHDKEVPISLNPSEFLDTLIKQLSNVYLTYIYICQHPQYPIIMIRIQVLDLTTIRIVSRGKRGSHKPYFFCIPMNSPHIIHTPSSTTVHRIVMDAVERSLPQNLNNLLKLHTPKYQAPVRDIHSMLIFTGNSRFSNSLGIWSAYADNRVDMLPLEPIERHQALRDDSDEEEDAAQELESQFVTRQDSQELQRLKKIANIRFKGSASGRMKSTVLFDHVADQTAKVFPAEEVESPYQSIAAVRYAEFIVRETSKPETISFKIKLSGNDIYGGLHELSVFTDDPSNMIVNPEHIPLWLTGEEGNSSGEVIDSVFVKKKI